MLCDNYKIFKILADFIHDKFKKIDIKLDYQQTSASFSKHLISSLCFL